MSDGAQPVEPFFAADESSVRLVDPPLPTGPLPTAGGSNPAGPKAVVSDGESADQTPTDGAGVAEPSVAVPSPWLIPSPAGERVAFSFNLAKIDGQGEDADPLLLEARDLGLLAVFDGMGGAGGTSYATIDGPRTGAYLASRCAREVVERRMLDLRAPSGDGAIDLAIAAELQTSIQDELRCRLAELRAPRSALRSKLLRALPTTMAMAAVQRAGLDSDHWECHVLWAGDSRVYVLRPDTGAAQLTTDDIRDRGDAMANLSQDSVISNAMSADTEFIVNDRRFELNTPFLLVAATDGCFGYFSSPMHFEGLLLSTLVSAPDQISWSEDLQAHISAITGDDASMAVLGIGADHQGLQSLFADRAAAVELQWVSPLDQLAADVRDAEQHLDVLRRQRAERAAELWAAYRAGYEQYLAMDAPGRDT